MDFGLKFQDLLNLSGKQADRTAEALLITQEQEQGMLTAEQATEQLRDVRNRKATTGTLIDVMTSAEIRESKLSDEEKKANAEAADAVARIQRDLVSRQTEGWLNRARATVQPQDLFFYICITLGLLFFSKFFIANVTTVIALAASAVVVWALIESRYRTQDESLKRLQIQMYEIRPAVKYFFVDVELVMLIRRGMRFREWAPQTWDDAVKALDQFCSVRFQAQPDAFSRDLVGGEFAVPPLVGGGMGRCHSQITQLRDYMSQALNQMKSLVLTAPIAQHEVDRFTNFLRQLHLLLQQRLDTHIDECNSRSTRATRLYKSHPEPLDHQMEPNYSMFV